MSGAGQNVDGLPSPGPEGLFSSYAQDPAFYDEIFDQGANPH